MAFPPQFDQSTFFGRFRHFVAITNPLNILVSDQKLEEAKEIVEHAKNNPSSYSARDFYAAQTLYLSAYHPDTGEKCTLAGRMSFQVYGGTVLCAAMMIFYQYVNQLSNQSGNQLSSTPAVVFWQWANQSFNAMVNYTNRNAKSELSNKELGIAYVSATAAGVSTSLGLKAMLAKRVHQGALLQRLVPMAALIAANCVNIPLMRQNELRHGVALVDEKDNEIARSQYSASKGIGQVVISRNFIGGTPMLLVPLIVGRLQQYRWFTKRGKLIDIPMQVGLTALILAFTVPVGCALYPQRSSVTIEALHKWEPKAYKDVMEKDDSVHRLYFNKGL